MFIYTVNTLLVKVSLLSYSWQNSWELEWQYIPINHMHMHMHMAPGLNPLLLLGNNALNFNQVKTPEHNPTTTGCAICMLPFLYVQSYFMEINLLIMMTIDGIGLNCEPHNPTIGSTDNH